MKKTLLYSIVAVVVIFLVIGGWLFFFDNYRARHWGGKAEIHVTPGYKVTNATFKEGDLWYFIEPMEEEYIPGTKQLIESSMMGVLEGQIIFYESK